MNVNIATKEPLAMYDHSCQRPIQIDNLSLLGTIVHTNTQNTPDVQCAHERRHQVKECNAVKVGTWDRLTVLVGTMSRVASLQQF
jgi:hypothetical protein